MFFLSLILFSFLLCLFLSFFLSYQKECFEDGLLHVSLLVLLLVQDELVQVVLEVVGHPGPAVAVVHAEEGQVGVALQVGEGRAPAKERTKT